MEKFRILDIELQNFKNIEEGYVDFGNFKDPNFIQENKLIGIYGQNGSGKTCIVEAIDLIQKIMLGKKLNDYTHEFITKNKKFMKIKISFYFENDHDDSDIFSKKEIFEYEVTITKNESKSKTTNEMEEESNLLVDHNSIEDIIEPALFINEILKYKDFKNNNWNRNKILIKHVNNKLTYNANNIISSSDLKLCSELAKKQETSLIFSLDFLRRINKYVKASDSIDSNKIIIFLYKLRFILERNLAVIDNKFTSIANCNFAIPLTYGTINKNKKQEYSKIFISLDEPEFIEINIVESLEKFINKTNVVLSCLIPNLKIKVKKHKLEKNANNKTGQKIELFSIRNSQEIPLRHESDGIKKIFSLLVNLILVFNDPAFILIIDEFDANLFEYLLGEMIELIEEYGKGQLIFTSHNLRPLEVLDKNHLRFTSFNPKKRFVKIPIKSTNNLRDQYMKNIFLKNEDLNLYSSCSTSELRYAFKKVGCFDEK